MHPILLQGEIFFLSSWHACYGLAGLAAWYLLQRLRIALLPELTKTEIDRLFIACYVLGYLGARLFSIFHEGEFYQPEFTWQSGLLQLGSMTLYGGVIAVTGFLILYASIRRLPLLGLADLITIPALAAIGLGRVGCFLNGDDYGRVGTGPFTVIFPNLEDGLPRYPVQIWESGFCWAMGLFLIYRIKWRRGWNRGQIADLGITSYCLARFFLEFWRGDDRGSFELLPSIFSPAQWLSIFFIFLWIIYRASFQKYSPARS